GSIATSSGVSLSGSGATFDISAANSSQTIQDLSGAAGSTVTLGNNSLTVGTANSTSFAGSIGGNGFLVKQGTRTLTLTGARTYGGGTHRTGGPPAVRHSNPH